MKILQLVVSKNHLNAMFYHGVIAEGKGYKLETYQDGEIIFMDHICIGDGIIELGKKGFINDNDIENEVTLNILVDKFFTITKDGKPINDDLLYGDYNEAILAFSEFLKQPLNNNNMLSEINKYEIQIDNKPNGAVIRLNNENGCILRICGVPKHLVFEPNGEVRKHIDITYPIKS